MPAGRLHLRSQIVRDSTDREQTRRHGIVESSRCSMMLASSAMISAAHRAMCRRERQHRMRRSRGDGVVGPASPGHRRERRQASMAMRSCSPGILHVGNGTFTVGHGELVLAQADEGQELQAPCPARASQHAAWARALFLSSDTRHDAQARWPGLRQDHQRH
jgi:hypothetical protein